MKKNLFLLLALATIMAISACKKNNDNNNNGGVTGTVSNGQASLPSDAAGAFYAIRQNINASVQYSAYAWFGNYTATQYVSSLTVNGTPMTDTIGGFLPTAWYEVDPSSYTVDLSATAVAWVSSGNGALSIPAINYTDQSNFPNVTYNLPSTISATGTLTIAINVTGSDSGIIALITGGTTGATYTKNYSPSSTSVSFNATELAKVISPGDLLGVEIMPISYFSQTYSGKKYYFVKQNAVVQYTQSY